jgi:hypothetical protein
VLSPYLNDHRPASFPPRRSTPRAASASAIATRTG